MANKSFRRLARDHASLHNEGLPPNYLFHPNTHSSDTFNSLSVYLVGPTGSPYFGGIFHLDLSIPSSYPASPPTAFFRTKVFHPNVDPATGAVCVETLKRDWTPDLTLRHVLVTIYCLLLYPNPSSALNEDAGLLVEKDYPSFERRATLWTNMHAAVPKALEAQVDDARRRGEDVRESGIDATKVAGTTRQEKRKKEESHTAIVADENISQSQAPSSQTSNTMRVSFHTPSQPLQPSARQDIALQEPKQTPMDLDTPILTSQAPTRAQPPAPPLRSRRLRDRYTLNRSSTAAEQTDSTPQTAHPSRLPPPIFRMTKSRDPTSQSTATSLDSFQTAPTSRSAAPLLTPSPSQSPPFQSFAVIDAEPEPKPKRLRLSTSPDQPSRFIRSTSQDERHDEEARVSLTPEIPLDQYMIDLSGSGGGLTVEPVVTRFPWLDWSLDLDMRANGLGLGVVDVDMDAASHRSQEKRRWERAGGCAGRYNSGCFGPRMGVLRL